ncbi:hypothetical protein CERSUDRAFT_110630 [Gelatoporia subvermispora B]|uniref:GST N-terminal domain-containing protein n=1 Tax=Ceriporiopsis subvermispora (strain B) TaxID=914234 RepID=M2RT23_CERS8|nr:hypothetical protein CERSUDRAFT_110630 [Gelatoporia subvermispora B]
MSAISVPKAALYYYPVSIWASVALLTLEEKGYGPDEVDLKDVDLSKGENFQPAYMRINQNATVPTLVVPLQDTLSSDIESRYKALQDTKTIVEFLDKSRSTMSRTHTTSSAPSPSLSPATIAFSTLCNKIVELLHSEEASPFLITHYARDVTGLREIASARLGYFTARLQKLDQLIADSQADRIRASEKTRIFWEGKREILERLRAIYADAEKDTVDLDETARTRREQYFAIGRKAWSNTKNVLIQLSKDIIGAYSLGDQLSIADMHLAPWFTRLAKISGATAVDDGNTVVRKIEAHVGQGLTLPRDLSMAEARRRIGVPAVESDADEQQARLAAFWDAIRERPSWKKVYANGLH